MRRREIVALLGSAAVCPFAARAQQPAMPVIGYLGAGWPDASTNLVASFRYPDQTLLPALSAASSAMCREISAIRRVLWT
jgi:hypothetical protein